MNQVSVYCQTGKVDREPSISPPCIKEINNRPIGVHDWAANCPLSYSTSGPDGNSLCRLHLQRGMKMKAI